MGLRPDRQCRPCARLAAAVHLCGHLPVGGGADRRRAGALLVQPAPSDQPLVETGCRPADSRYRFARKKPDLSI
ncbi:protein of unknown function [Cupriavidus taiwanensis]|nr:protein of unknown function [Cupriavidus taiwanensis]